MGGEKPHLLVGIGQQPRRRDARRVRAVDEVLPAGQARRHAVGHAAAVPGARRRARRDASIASAATGSSTRYAYHHGYFDGVEREFRGFGLVEQWRHRGLRGLRRRRRAHRGRPGARAGALSAAGDDAHLVPHRRVRRRRSRPAPTARRVLPPAAASARRRTADGPRRRRSARLRPSAERDAAAARGVQLRRPARSGAPVHRDRNGVRRPRDSTPRDAAERGRDAAQSRVGVARCTIGIPPIRASRTA